MKIFFLASFLMFFVACTPGDPRPELADPIYKDLAQELDIARRALELEEKNLKELEKEKSLVVPQTGQIKFANKKISDSQEKIMILGQRLQYFKISLERRASVARTKYSESLASGGRAWPDQEEAALYYSVTKFQRDKLVWDRTKGVKKDVPRGTLKK